MEQGESITPENIDQVMDETLQRANKILSALEIAMAHWNSADEKPEHLRDKFERYGRMHHELSRWEKNALLSIGKKQDYDVQVKRLREFVRIFN